MACMKMSVVRILDAKFAVMAAALVAVIVITIYPTVLLFIRSFLVAGTFSFQNYVRAFSIEGNFEAIYNSIWVSATVTLLCVIIGTCLAWLTSRTDIGNKSHLRTLFMIPFSIPPFVGAMAWIRLFGPAGLANQLLEFITGTEREIFNVYSPSGVVLVLAVHYYPFVFINVGGALDRMDPTLEESARIAGASVFRTMRTITLPLVAPAIVAGGILAFIGTIENFGIPAMLGMRARFFVLPTVIYRLLHVPDIPAAIALSIFLIALTILALFAQSWILGRRRYTVISGKAIQPRIARLGVWKPALTIGAWVFVCLVVILPLFAVFVTASTKYVGAPLVPENFTVKYFLYILFEFPMTQRAILNSLFLAGAAATIAMLLGAVISYMKVKARVPGSGILDAVGTIPYAIPGIVIGVSMILAWSVGPIVLYGTIWIMLMAYLMRYLPSSIRSTNATLHQIDDSLEEAARTSGASWIDAFKDVVLPLLRPGMLAGWILVFVPAFRELTISVLLWSGGTETVGVAIYELQDAGYKEIAAALACIVLGIALVGDLLIWRIKGWVERVPS